MCRHLFQEAWTHGRYHRLHVRAQLVQEIIGGMPIRQHLQGLDVRVKRLEIAVKGCGVCVLGFRIHSAECRVTDCGVFGVELEE